MRSRSRLDALVCFYKSRLYRAGPRQHEESSLGVNARAARNHIRHEQAAMPREFTSASLRFRHGGSWRRTTTDAVNSAKLPRSGWSCRITKSPSKSDANYHLAQSLGTPPSPVIPSWCDENFESIGRLRLAGSRRAPGSRNAVTLSLSAFNWYAGLCARVRGIVEIQ